MHIFKNNKYFKYIIRQYVRYEVYIIYGLKVIVNVKVDNTQTERQVNVDLGHKNVGFEIFKMPSVYCWL